MNVMKENQLFTRKKNLDDNTKRLALYHMLEQNYSVKLCVSVHTFSPSTGEAETGGSL